MKYPKIDEIAIWRRALSVAEVAALTPPFGPPGAPLPLHRSTVNGIIGTILSHTFPLIHGINPIWFSSEMIEQEASHDITYLIFLRLDAVLVPGAQVRWELSPPGPTQPSISWYTGHDCKVLTGIGLLQEECIYEVKAIVEDPDGTEIVRDFQVIVRESYYGCC